MRKFQTPGIEILPETSEQARSEMKSSNIKLTGKGVSDIMKSEIKTQGRYQNTVIEEFTGSVSTHAGIIDAIMAQPHIEPRKISEKMTNIERLRNNDDDMKSTTVKKSKIEISEPDQHFLQVENYDHTIDSKMGNLSEAFGISFGII